MATKGKTRGPQESKHVKKTDNQDEKFQTKSKRSEEKVGIRKK
jgi:hypothetical protein